MAISIFQNIDCMEGMKKIPDKAFKWAFADIPYGLDVAKMAFTQEVKNTVLQKNGNRLRIPKEKYALKNWDKEVPKQPYFDEVVRVSENQIIFGVEYVDWEGLGTGRIKWDKCVPDGMSFKPYEMAYCSAIEHTEEIKLLWSGMMQAKSIFHPTTQQGNKRLNEKRIHPTQKPRLLYQLLFNMFCKEGDNILDTHVGSGSSRIVADKMGFDYCGFEIDRDYFEKSNERFFIETSMPLFYD
jgi:site-specific DNA-methyltransferase (adenine-specific)